jgi:WD40 repeat protein
MSRTALLALLLSATTVTATKPAQAQQPSEGKVLDDSLPKGAKVRLGTTGFRNIWSEAPVVLSPDGKTLAVMKEQKALMFMNAATGKVSRTLQLPGISSGRVEYLPGGKLMAIASFPDRLSVVDVETGRIAAEVPTQVGRSRGDSVVSTDGTRAAFSDSDTFADFEKMATVVTVWDFIGKKALVTVTPLQNEYVRVCLSADGKVLATWGRYRPPVTPEGTIVRSTKDAQEYTVQVWDSDTGTERCKVVLGSIGFRGADPHGFFVTAALSPDGKQLATAGVHAGVVELFDSATGKAIGRFARRGAPVKRLVYSSDGSLLAALGFDGAVQVWDVKAGTRLGVVESPIGRVDGAVFPDADRVIAWGMQDRAVALWELPSGKRLHVPEEHTEAITSILFSADRKKVFTVGSDHIIAEWDAATGKMHSASRMKLPERVRPEGRRPGDTRGFAKPDVVVLSPDSKLVAVACNGTTLNELLVLERATGTELFGVKTGFPASRWYLPPVLSTDGSRLFYARGGFTPVREGDRRLPVWDIDSGRPICRIALQDQTSCPFPAAFSPDGTRLVTLAVEGEGTQISFLVNSWNPETGIKIAEHVVFTGSAVKYDDGTVAVAPDNRTAVVVARGPLAKAQRLLTWDIATGKVLKEMPIPDTFHLRGPVTISPDGKTFAVAGRFEDFTSRSVILVCDLSTGAIRHEFHGSEERVTVLAFSPDGKTLASGSTDTTVLLWDLAAK